MFLEKYEYSSPTRLYLKKDNGQLFSIEQWRLAVQQSCKNIPCFSICCEGEINVQIVSDDGEDLEPGVLRSKQSSKLRWKRSSIQGRKNSMPKNNIQYFCDVKVPLLQIVGIEGQHRKSVTKAFDRPQYLPVCRQTLDTIEIDIKDNAGDSISFQHGKVVVKLHVRKQRSSYFS